MISDKNFKFSRASKCVLASLRGSKESRGDFKRAMITAQVADEAARRASLRSRDGKESKDTK